MNAVVQEADLPVTAAELIKHCRERRTGIPAGDAGDPKVLRRVLTLLLERHVARITAAPPWWNEHIKRADPREDETACALATFIGYLEDRAK